MFRDNKRLTVKIHLTRWGIMCLAVVVALGTIGVSYAQRSGMGKGPGNNIVETNPCGTELIWVVSNDNGVLDNQGGYDPIDPGDFGLDPSESQTAGNECARYDKNVATTHATLTDPGLITVIINNAYPSYYPTIFYGLENKGTIPGTIQTIEVDEDATTPDVIDDIDELLVTVTGIYEGQEIAPGIEIVGDLDIHVEQAAAQNATYTIRVKITIVCVPKECGTGYAYGGDYATCFTDLIKTNNWGWSNGPLPPDSYTFDIYAGAGGCDITGGTLVGELTVNYDGTMVTVNYNLYAGYTMDVTHLYVGTEPLPENKKGNPTVSPGQYPYSHALEDATTDSYEIDGFSGDDIYVVAHAVVCWFPE